VVASAPKAPLPRFSLRRVGFYALFALALVGGGLFGLFLGYASDLPQVGSLEDFQPNIITQVLSADGVLLGEFAIERRVVVTFQDIPPLLRNAVIAVEDAEFWKHIGINFWRIPGAALANFRSGRYSQGFSTLTMQISRILFLTPEKTPARKLQEIILAFQIEKNFTKEEILALYCNQMYFGHGNYGVEAASRFFFSKSIQQLTLPEAALIAGILQNPTRLSPIEFPERARERRNHVLDRMQEEKYISESEASKARAEPLRLNLRRDPPSIAPYFVEEVRKYLEREYGSQRIYQGGLRVYTTLDSRLQRAANRALRNGLIATDKRSRGFVKPAASALVKGELPERIQLDEWAAPLEVGDVVRGVVLSVERASAWVQIGERRARIGLAEIAWTGKAAVSDVLAKGTVAPFRILALPGASGGELQLQLEQEPKLEGSLLALDVRSGAVKAMVGGYDFERSKFNRATQALRQVGSAFKPLLYAAAVEKAGYSPATIIVDSPLSLPAGNNTTWTPHNYDGTYWGAIPLRRALENSRNIPAIKTLQHIGIDTGIAYARKLGLTGELPPYLPIAIGAGESTLVEMTAAFATFPNQGLRMKPMLVTRISDREGNTIEENRPHAEDAIRADTAYIMVSLMRGVVERGTAVRAKALKRPVAGKTGTTNDFTDAWFIGYEPSLAAGVWVGFDDKRISMGAKEEGGRVALPIWMEFWAEATKDRPIEDYPVPGNIVFVPIDGIGRPGRPGWPGVTMEPFVAGTEPGAVVAAAGTH
jgi:penicillin-binding protein 1A